MKSTLSEMGFFFSLFNERSCILLSGKINFNDKNRKGVFKIFITRTTTSEIPKLTIKLRLRM